MKSPRSSMQNSKKTGQFRHVRTVVDIAEYRHKNGLTVLYMHKPGTESVTVNVVYHVGSRHEPRGKTGMAHMLEHMLFKETLDQNGKVVPSHHKVLENKGAISNASTWDDRTNYYCTMPARYLEEILAFEAVRMRRLVLTNATFKPEQQNVLSEYEMYADRPEFMLGNAIAVTAFVSHGYGHDTIGHKPDIEGLTHEDLRAFYDLHYWPDNATLVVVGDVTKDRVLSAIADTFGAIPARVKPAFHSIEEPPLIGVRRIELRKESPMSLAAWAFHAPSGKDPAWAALFVALTYLTDGRLAPLHKKLVETHLCSSILGTLFLSHDPHILTIAATLTKNGKPSEVERVIRREIDSLRRKPISQKALARILEKIIADTLLSRDGTNAIARELTEYVASGDWTLYYSLLDALRAVTTKDVHAAATTWLTPERSILGTLIGETSKPS